MDAVTGFLSANPEVIAISVAVVILLLLYFILKSFFKIMMIALVILLAAFGYYSFQDPAKVPDNIRKPMEAIKSGFNDLTGKSKTFLKDTKDLYKETKNASGDVNKLLKDSDQQAEKEFKK